MPARAWLRTAQPGLLTVYGRVFQSNARLPPASMPQRPSRSFAVCLVKALDFVDLFPETPSPRRSGCWQGVSGSRGGSSGQCGSGQHLTSATRKSDELARVRDPACASLIRAARVRLPVRTSEAPTRHGLQNRAVSGKRGVALRATTGTLTRPHDAGSSLRYPHIRSVRWEMNTSVAKPGRCGPQSRTRRHEATRRTRRHRRYRRFSERQVHPAGIDATAAITKPCGMPCQCFGFH